MRPFGSDLPSCANGLCRGQKDNWSLWCTPQRQRTCTSASAYEQPNALNPWLVSNRTQQAAMQGRVRDQKMCSDAHLHSRSQFLTFLIFIKRKGADIQLTSLAACSGIQHRCKGYQYHFIIMSSMATCTR